MLIKAPVLTSIGVQSVIRHGGQGKVIVRLSGNAPAGGVTVGVTTSPSGYLDVGPTVVIPAGANRISLKVSANLFGEAADRLPDLPVSVTVTLGDTSLTKGTIIQDYGDDPRPTPTNTATPTETAIATDTATATATDTAIATATKTNTATPTATNTATSTPTNPATATPTATATVVLYPLITMTFLATGSPGYCGVTVIMTGFAPNTLYPVLMYSTFDDGSGPVLEGSPQTTTDSLGNSTFTPSTFRDIWAFKAVVGAYTSAVYPVNC